MMLEYMEWREAADLIHRATEKTLAQRKGTYDLVRGWVAEGEKGATELKCSEFGAALAENM
jgi:isocitrate dehydrogenase